MPDIVVEIAFDSGYATPAASRTWTDISSYVDLKDLVGIGVGRGDEFAVADANSLSLTVDNTDGRFSPDYASGAYYPNVKIGRPIRVKITPPSGSTCTRFLGFVDEWPVEWDGGTTHAKAKITARSRLARLGLDAAMTSQMLSACLNADPHILYRLNEGASPARDSSPSIDTDLTQTRAGTVTWNGGVGPDGMGTAIRSLPAATGEVFHQLSGRSHTAFAPFVVEFCLHVPSAPDDDGTIFDLVRLEDSATGDRLLDFGADGADIIASGDAFEVTTPYARDVVNHVGLAVDGTSARLYLNGTLVATDSATPAALPSAICDVTLAYRNEPGESVRYNDLSYVMFSDDEAGIPDRAELRNVATTVSDALTSYAIAAGIEASGRSIGTTSETIEAPIITDQSPLAAMRTAEATDGGVIFDAPDGTFTYKTRDSRYTATSAFTLAAASQEIETDFAPKLDRTGLVNAATVTGADSASAYVQDATSVGDYGLAATSRETLGDYDQCFQAASWAVHLGKDPAVRVASVTVDLLTCPTATRDLILAATVGTRFTISGLPSQAPASSMDFFIEGWAEVFGPETHRITFNTTRRTSLYDVWTVEDATYGQYDAYPIAW